MIQLYDHPQGDNYIATSHDHVDSSDIIDPSAVQHDRWYLSHLISVVSTSTVYTIRTKLKINKSHSSELGLYQQY